MVKSGNNQKTLVTKRKQPSQSKPPETLITFETFQVDYGLTQSRATRTPNINIKGLGEFFIFI